MKPNIQGVERVSVTFDAVNTTWHAAHELLEAAREAGKEGPVARHLVGANLALRFPDLDVRNNSASTHNVGPGSRGDYLVNDTAFHVTVTPTPGQLAECAANVGAGYNVCLLVPDRLLKWARQDAELTLPGKITTRSIESFVSFTTEALAAFSKDAMIGGLRRLLEKYNERVDTAELDKSLLIEISLEA